MLRPLSPLNILHPHCFAFRAKAKGTNMIRIRKLPVSRPGAPGVSAVSSTVSSTSAAFSTMVLSEGMKLALGHKQHLQPLKESCLFCIFLRRCGSAAELPLDIVLAITSPTCIKVYVSCLDPALAQRPSAAGAAEAEAFFRPELSAEVISAASCKASSSAFTTSAQIRVPTGCYSRLENRR